MIGKKVKRTGEASLFSEQNGKLTDEATNMCRSLGIETKDLYPKYVNLAFFKIRPLRLIKYNLLMMCLIVFVEPWIASWRKALICRTLKSVNKSMKSTESWILTCCSGSLHRRNHACPTEKPTLFSSKFLRNSDHFNIDLKWFDYSRLAMPHEEKQLKTAFKIGGRNASMSGFIT